jgi:hypothetical protein
MIRYFYSIVIAIVLIGCSSSEDNANHSTEFQKNQCVTAGSAYEVSYQLSMKRERLIGQKMVLLVKA